MRRKKTASPKQKGKKPQHKRKRKESSSSSHHPPHPLHFKTSSLILVMTVTLKVTTTMFVLYVMGTILINRGQNAIRSSV
ncbi:hypothetical protein C0J52_11996 [Blattella germanica]|nr:hypothetical protein C0J52_11996 [Blattella germanica]